MQFGVRENPGCYDNLDYDNDNDNDNDATGRPYGIRLTPERAVLTRRHKDHKDNQCDMKAGEVAYAVIGQLPSMIFFSLCSLCLCVSNSRI